LTSPMAVIGPIELDLFISSDVEDTDFIARLCVQESSGAITCLALGSLRCRYRDSWANPKPLTPGNITPIHLQMGHTAYVFPAGSRMCLIITSSDFPRIQPHPNTMASPFSETKPITAINSILHGDTTPSCLKLPIVSIQ
jgi:putative CocE/NonD family hydrolase